MRKKAMGVVLVSALFGGCVAPQSPTVGSIFTNTHGPVSATSSPRGSKMGTAKATGILFFAFGDASIETAARSAGITKVTHVDHDAFGLLGLFASYTTKVYGE